MDIGSKGIVLSMALICQLICTFVFTYAKYSFSHEAAHLIIVKEKWCYKMELSKKNGAIKWNLCKFNNSS